MEQGYDSLFLKSPWLSQFSFEMRDRPGTVSTLWKLRPVYQIKQLLVICSRPEKICIDRMCITFLMQSWCHTILLLLYDTLNYLN